MSWEEFLSWARGDGVIVVESFGLVLGAWLLSLVFRWLYRKSVAFIDRATEDLRSVKIQHTTLFTANRLAQIVERAHLLAWTVLGVMAAYTYVAWGLTLFPQTRDLAGRLMRAILNPIRQLSEAVFDYLPNLLFILVTLFVVRYLLRFIRFIFIEIERENLKLRGFHPDWAQTTYALVKMLLFFFTAIIIFPYLPGADSQAFQGISVFAGILISLGSASAISNLVAGVVLTYMRPFRVGDRVKIADTVGDVIEKSLLVTRIRTLKNEEMTVPNSAVLSGSVVNFVVSQADKPVMITSSVTIGYDVPWKKVHELLLSAASDTADIEKQPAPFVVQRSLNDFSVHYELYAPTLKPHSMLRTSSALHANIQNQFIAAGVEILSPHFFVHRNGDIKPTNREH